MNDKYDKYIKEYEEMNYYDLADELAEPLFSVKQNEAKTIYIHYAKERDKNEQLQNNWNELKKFVEDEIIECKAIINTILPEFEKIMPRSSAKTVLTNEYNTTQTIIKCFEVMLNKMQELEQDKDENN